MKKNVVLLGMMGVGKSTLARIVAKKQNLKFIDTDSNIEKNFSMKISEIFKKKGEDFFRIEEEKVVLESLKKSKSVIALGGGAFINKVIRDAVLKNSISFWLDINLDIINKRIKWNKKRPLAIGKNTNVKIRKLYDQRKSIYKLANYKIDCNKLSKEDIVKKIINIY